MSLKIIIGSFLIFFVQTTVFATASTPRWYSVDQAIKGQSVFQKNCSTCHGANAQATPNWKQKNANGHYPPPPLNGTAHAWHHSLKALRRAVKDGGQKIGGLMPSFEQTLSDADRDDAIAFFQSQWDDELYNKWSNNFKIKALKKATVTDIRQNPVLNRLTKRINSAQIDSVKNIAANQLYEVKTQGQTLYLTKDGRFAIIGHLVDLETGSNLTDVK